MFEKGERTKYYVWKWLFNLTVNVKREQDKNKKMCSTKLWGVGHHSPQKNMTQKLLKEEKVIEKVVLWMSALNSPVPTKNSFETCEDNNSNLISAFSLSLSNISLSSGSFFLSTNTHTNKKKCKMKGGESWGRGRTWLGSSRKQLWRSRRWWARRPRSDDTRHDNAHSSFLWSWILQYYPTTWSLKDEKVFHA